MKRRPLSARTSRKIFRKGTRVNGRNAVRSVMRGGIRF